MDPTRGFEASQNAISESLIATTRTVATVAAQDLAFDRAVDPSIASSLDQETCRLLGLTEKLLSQTITGSSSQIPLPNVDAIEAKWTSLVDAADNLLEQTDKFLDEYSGLVKKHSDAEQPQAPTLAPIPPSKKLAKHLRFTNIPKPQNNFRFHLSNHETKPFKPLLRSKPNSKISLKESCVLEENKDGSLQYRHPYQDEINSYQYPASVCQNGEPQLYTPLGSTKATFVDTEQGLIEMVKHLKEAKEISVDLEHHSMRSYIGIVSLMQISTRNHDWIVDTLKPWRHKLEILNEVFTDPSIIKVFHGPSSDIVWLQSDFGVYVVGMFDTQAAAQVLGYPSLGLAYLLNRFANFDAQKQYQLADWRIRPLPPEMLEYARSDTHFLLYVYDRLRKELLEKSENENKDYFDDVLRRSKEIALFRFEHSFYDNSSSTNGYGWAPSLAREKGIKSNAQIAAYAALHRLRDDVGRDRDEGLGFVMSNKALTNVAKSLPQDFEGVRRACGMENLVKWKWREIIFLIKQAISENQDVPGIDSVAKPPNVIPGKLNPLSHESNKKINNKPAVSSQRLLESQLWNGNADQSSENNENVPLGIPHHCQLLLGPQITSRHDDVASINDVGSTTQVSPSDGKKRKRETATQAPVPRVLSKREDSNQSAKDPPDNGLREKDEAAIQEVKQKAEQKMGKNARKRGRRRERRTAPVNGANTSNESQETEQGNRNDGTNVLVSKPSEASKRLPIPSVKPHARAAETSTGLKRAGIHAAGKSGTFKQ